MDSSFLKPSRGARRLGALLSFCPCVVLAQADETPQTISLEAQSTSIDRASNKFAIEGVRITQGSLSIEADDALATGLDFDASEWQFTGNVRIVIDSAVITAQSAAFSFDSHQLIMGELLGEPVSFEDIAPEGEGPVRGTASRIFYNNLEGTVRMEGGATLIVGPNEIGGCDLIYDLDQEQVTSGTSNCGEPFRIVIVPPVEEAASTTDSSPLP